jgi:hypothetical protein
MAPSIAELPERTETTPFTVPVKTIPSTNEAAKSIEINEPIQTTESETAGLIETKKPFEKIETVDTTEKAKVRRIIDEEGGKTTATVSHSTHKSNMKDELTLLVPTLPPCLGSRREIRTTGAICPCGTWTQRRPNI